MDLRVFIGQREGGPHMSAPAVRTREFGCLVTSRTLTCRQYGALVKSIYVVTSDGRYGSTWQQSYAAADRFRQQQPKAVGMRMLIYDRRTVHR